MRKGVLFGVRRLAAALLPAACCRRPRQAAARKSGAKAPHSKLWHEAVAHAMDGQKMPRLGGRRLDLLPQPGDVRVDGPCEDGRIVTPDVAEQRLASNDGIGVIEKVAKDVELALGEINRHSSLA